jgi:hypothetical protein
VIGLTVVLLMLFGIGGVSLGAGAEGVQHYKMISTVEYSGKGQFRNQVGTVFTVTKQHLSDDSVRYFLSTKDFDLAGGEAGSGQEPVFKGLSFVVDKKTKYLSDVGEGMEFLAKVNNECVSYLTQTARGNIGKTWKQSFNLSSLDKSLSSELKLTLTAIQLKPEKSGEKSGGMIAVRALSEPFVIKATKENGSKGDVQSRVNAVYVFDPGIEDVYMSISVFDAATNTNGFKEKLRHEVATYQTDAAGTSISLGNLGKDFEKLVQKVGLSKESLKVVKASRLSRWAQSEGLLAAQVTNICAALACEGAVNPVATVFVPAARTVAMQGSGVVKSVGAMGTVGSLLTKGVPAVGGMKIAVAPAFLGVGPVGAAAAAGGAGVAAASGGGGGGGHRSPSTP